MVKNNLKNTTSGKKIDFPIPVSSYKMILIGFGIIILGFILMMGGGSDNPAEFNYDIFSFRVFWAIMRKPKKEMEEGTKD